LHFHPCFVSEPNCNCCLSNKYTYKQLRSPEVTRVNFHLSHTHTHTHTHTHSLTHTHTHALTHTHKHTHKLPSSHTHPPIPPTLSVDPSGLTSPSTVRLLPVSSERSEER